jgi:hypothetical protein
MQNSLRPYATAGVAIVGASIIAVTPMVVAPPIPVQARSVKLVDAWSDLISNTTANLDSIIANANSSDISQVFSELLTNPYGVLAAFANVDPTVTTDLTSLPGTISVELPPGLELAIAGLGSSGATLTALESVAQQLQSDPSFTNLYEGVATVLNAYLNGQDNISLLDGAITIPLYNGILAPETSLDVNINLTSLIDALGLGNTPLTDLDLSSLLSQIGLGDLNLGTLFSDLGLSTKGLGDLLGDPTLGTLLNDLGLGGLTSADGLGLGSFSLTDLLSDLGLDTSLGNVTLTQVLDALGLNADVSDLSLTGLISALFPNGLDVGSANLGTLLTDLGIGSDTIGSLLSTTDISDIAGLINGSLSTLIGSTLSALINPILAEIPVPPGDPAITIDSLVSPANLTTALDSVTLSTLVNDLTLGSGNPPTGYVSLTDLLNDLGLGSTTTGDLGSITALLTDLGIKLPSTTTPLTISSLITEVLNQLGLPIPATGDISLAALLTDLGGLTNSILDTNVGSLLNSLDLGSLLNDLGLSSLPLNLSDLGDLSNLTLGDLIGDLGLGDLASVSVEPLGGFDTLLADVVPQQILTALGM